MSATNRGGLARQPHDFYETPAEAVDLVLDALGIDATFEGYVIDPGAGTGAIASRVAARAPKADVRGVELVPHLIEVARTTRAPTVAWTEADWLTWVPDGMPDLIIGNPPYKLAEAFVRKALSVGGKSCTVAMLLRASFVVPKCRRALRAMGKPDLFFLERRPSFNGSGTDACDYAWCVWGPKRGGKWSVLYV